MLGVRNVSQDCDPSMFFRPWQTSYVTKLGQRRGMTRYDIQKINALYKCQSKPIPTTTVTTCSDKYPTCQTLWSKNNGCQKYKPFMQDFCQKSCGLCKQPGPIAVVINNSCKDNDVR